MNTLTNYQFIMHPKVLVRNKKSTRMTIGALYNEESETLLVGSALCGNKDNFSKLRGRTIALGRAKKNSLLVSRNVPSFHDAKERFYHDVVPTVLQLNNASLIEEEEK